MMFSNLPLSTCCRLAGWYRFGQSRPIPSLAAQPCDRLRQRGTEDRRASACEASALPLSYAPRSIYCSHFPAWLTRRKELSGSRLLVPSRTVGRILEVHCRRMERVGRFDDGHSGVGGRLRCLRRRRDLRNGDAGGVASPPARRAPRPRRPSLVSPRSHPLHG